MREGIGMSKRGMPAVRKQMSYAGAREEGGDLSIKSSEPENSSGIAGLFRNTYGAGGGRGPGGVERAYIVGCLAG